MCPSPAGGLSSNKGRESVVMLHCFSPRLVLRFECSRARLAPRPRHPVADDVTALPQHRDTAPLGSAAARVLASRAPPLRRGPPPPTPPGRMQQ